MRTTTMTFLIRTFWLLLLSLLLGAVVHASITDIRNEFPTQERVLELAYLSRHVYSINSTETVPVPGDNITLNETNYTVISWIDRDSTEVLMTSTTSNNDVIVTFRGTEEITDWVVNLQFNQVPLFPNAANLSTNLYHMLLPPTGDNDNVVPIQAHQGFHQVYALYQDILKLIRPHVKGRRVYVTGHSLGGANAHLFSTLLALSQPGTTEVQCITYGQPRVGNLGMKMLVEQIYNLNMWRLVNQDDVVPRIPLPSQGFLHAGHYYYRNSPQNNNRTGAYYRQIGDATQNYEGIPDLTYAQLGNSDPNNFVRDHSMELYIDWISTTTLPQQFSQTNGSS